MESREHRREVAQPLLADVAPGDVRAERQRQTRLEKPPLAEVDALLQTGVPVGQLALVDEEARRGAARDCTSSRISSNGTSR